MAVTQEQIDGWKDTYQYVYKVTMDGVEYYFRTLSRDDYMTIQTKVATEGPSFDNELEVALTCVLDPAVTAEGLKAKAGLVSVLSEKIMLRSGFQAVEEIEL